MRAHRPARCAAATAALLAAAALAGCGSGSGTAASASVSGPVQEFEGAALPGPAAPRFALRDQSGREVALAAAGGRVTVLAFLYTGCTACVLIAQQIRGALDQLPSAPRVLIVSVDPAADTPPRVRAFLARVALRGRASWLGGTEAQLAPVWRSYRVRTPAQGLAQFERAAPVLLIDRTGRERVIYQEEQLTPEALAHDIRRLQEG